MTLYQSISVDTDQQTPITCSDRCGNLGAGEPTLKFGPEHPTDEQVWIAGLQRGDEECYEQLVRQYTGRLLGVARRYLAEQEAQDAVQEAFIKAFENIGTFRAASRLSTWLHRILINTCLSRLRRASVRREVSIESVVTSCGHNDEPVDTTQPWPDHFASVTQLRQIVRSCIANLPENYRTVILLRDIEGYSGEETAQHLDISANLVKVRLHRARRTLHKQLSVIFLQSTDAKYPKNRL